MPHNNQHTDGGRTITDVPLAEEQQVDPNPSITDEEPEEVPRGFDPETSRHIAEKTVFALDEDPSKVHKFEQAAQEGRMDELDAAAVEVSIDEDQALRQELVDEAIRRKGGEPLDELERSAVQSLMTPSQPDPEIERHKRFSRKAMTQSLSQSEDPHVQEMVESDIPEVEAAMDTAENAGTIMEIIKEKREELLGRDIGMGQTISDFSERLLPGFLPGSDFQRIRGIDFGGQTEYVAGTGTRIEDLRSKIYNMPPKAAKRVVENELDSLAEENLGLAVEVADKLISYPTTEFMADQIFTLLDAADVTEFGGLALKVAKTGALVGAMRGVLRGLAPRRVKTQRYLEEIGEVSQAASLKAKMQVMRKARNLTDAKSWDSVAENIPSIFNPRAVVSGPNMSGDKSQRLLAGLQANQAKLLDVMSNTMTINRGLASELDSAVMEVRQRFNTQFPTLANRVLDVVPFRSADETLAKTDVLEVRIGKDADGSLFESQDKARLFAEDFFGLSGYEIKQQGGKHYISVRKTYDESSPLIMQTLLKDDETTPSGSLLDRYALILRDARTPEELLTKIQRADRTAATTGSTRLIQVMGDIAKNVTRLNRRKRKRLTEFLHNQRDWINYRDPEAPPGKFSSNQGEFESDWHSKFGTWPDEETSYAYWSYVQLNDMDYAIRNMSMFRDKGRLGIENHAVRMRTRPSSGVTSEAPLVEGKTVQSLPEGGEDAGILVVGGRKRFSFMYKNDNHEELQRLMDEKGYQLIQVTPDGERTLMDIDDVSERVGRGKVNYVLAQNAQARPLTAKQLPYNPGGHIKYVDGFYVSQPNVVRELDENGGLKRLRYDGDTALVHFTTEAQANKYLERIEHAKKLLKEGREEELTSYLDKNLPWGDQEFRDLFSDDGPLKESEDLYVIGSNERIGDTEKFAEKYPKVNDSRFSRHNLMSSANMKFTGDRDEAISTIREGTKRRPLMHFDKASKVDAMTTMSQAVASLSDNLFLDDFKLKMSKTFVKEFGDLLNVPKEELERNPLPYILSDNPSWKDTVGDRERLAQAKTMWRTTRQFLGISTDYQKGILRVKQNLANSLYRATGEKGVDLVQPWMMSTIKDPSAFMKNLGFHTTLGLFNPVQLLLQAQSFTHVAAFGGVEEAMRSVPATWMMWGLRKTDQPQIAARFGKEAKAWGWEPEHFRESYEAMVKSGWDAIGGEVAYRDDVFNPQVLQSRVGSFLDKGAVFFNSGERFVRMSAWNTSYSRWRKANPKAKFNEKAQQSVLAEAKTLSVDMINDANAQWQRGFKGVITQFWSYQTRLAEQFTGRRWSKAEKARALGVYSVMYGIPAAGGAATTAPFYEEIRSRLQEEGIQYDDTVLEWAMDGAPAMLLEGLTGSDLNFPDRFSPEGPGGISALWDVWNGDKEIWEMLIGASGTKLTDMLQSAEPLYHKFTSMVDSSDTTYPLRSGDLVDFARNISSLNQFSKAWYGVWYGAYYSRNEQLLDEVTPLESVFQAITGLSPERMPRGFAMMNSNKQFNNMVENVTNLVKQDFVKQMRAAKDGDEEAVDDYASRINHLLKPLPPQVVSRIMSRAAEGQKSLILEAARSFREFHPERDEVVEKWMRTRETELERGRNE